MGYSLHDTKYMAPVAMAYWLDDLDHSWHHTILLSCVVWSLILSSKENFKMYHKSSAIAAINKR